MTATIDNGIKVKVRPAKNGRWGFEVETMEGITVGWGADAQDALIDANKTIRNYDLKVN